MDVVKLILVSYGILQSYPHSNCNIVCLFLGCMCVCEFVGSCLAIKLKVFISNLLCTGREEGGSS